MVTNFSSGKKRSVWSRLIFLPVRNAKVIANSKLLGRFTHKKYLNKKSRLCLQAHGYRPRACRHFWADNPLSFCTGGTSLSYFTAIILKIPLFSILKWQHFLFLWASGCQQPSLYSYARRTCHRTRCTTIRLSFKEFLH